jgi:hypothetical protein
MKTTIQQPQLTGDDDLYHSRTHRNIIQVPHPVVPALDLGDVSTTRVSCDGTSQVIRPTYSCPCSTNLRQPCRCT